MYVYIRSEPRLWTVGFYRPDGTWQSESDHGDRAEAAVQVARLNSENPPPRKNPSKYVYIRSEPRLWTVGFYRPDGTWESESDGDRAEAAARAAWLNGEKE